MTDDPSASDPDPKPSWARGGADVVLLRALGTMNDGRFLELRDGDADGPPAMKSFLDLGWTGAFGASADLADPAAIDGHLDAIGPGDVHVVFVAADLPTTDPGPVLGLTGRRPWVLVVGVHPDHDRAPLTEALDAAGYRFCLFDGMSAYYVAAEQAADLRHRLSYPACARDHYLPRPAARLLEAARLREARALESAIRWREKAVRSWADNSAAGAAERAELFELREHADDLATQLAQLQGTLSWRVTAPLRRFRRLGSARDAS